jgi:outer membrane protein assembly factor BamA
MRSFIGIGFILFLTCSTWAQGYYAIENSSNPLPKTLSVLQSAFNTKFLLPAWQKKYNEWQSLALAEGYFLFALEPRAIKDSVQYFHINPGPFFECIALKSPTELNYLSAKELQLLVQDSLNWYVNNGYPFAQISLQVSSGSVPIATLQTTKGPEVKWGQIHVKPEGVIKEKVLANLLQIESGTLFSEQQLLQAEMQVAGQLPFKLLRSPEWALEEQNAAVYLFLERIKMSSATGIIGLQQNPSTQKNALVGELNLQLQNTWQKNEKFTLHWRSIAPQTQLLKSTLTWPYIGGSSYGVNAGFSLYRRDTSFLELKGNIGLTYLLANNWQLLAILDYWQSNALTILSTLASLETFSTLSYGVGLQRQKLDFLPNPRKGMQLKASYLVGNKKAQNDLLTWRLELSQRYFLPLTKRQVLSLSQEFAHIQSATLFSNELYRFGGLERMRGFDEEAFFVSTLAFAGLEYRFLLDQYAHFLVFTDWAWLQNKVLGQQQTSVYAVGLGLVLGSENGQFKLSYGLGSQLGQPLQLNAGKLHVGFISYF